MNTEKLFQNGFNNGYLLSKHNPELLNKITAGLKPGIDYVSGLFAGRQQHEIETARTKMQERNKEGEKSNSLPGKDIEPEHL